MLNFSKIEIKVNKNLKNTRLEILFLPILVLLGIAFFLFNKNAFSVEGYIKVQENLFYSINGKLAELPNLQLNLTQLGDALILFPLLTIFIMYAPKLWGAIITSGIISLILSFLLKKIFAVPRPAAIFDNDSFTIIGRTLTGHNSLPSGHTITVFSIITIVLFAFMPKKNKYKLVWSICILAIGFILAFSRVGVGAHYPIDVLVGSSVGFICAILGMVINNRVNWWNWIGNKKYDFVFMLLLSICGVVIVKKIIHTNLLIFYISLLSMIPTFYFMIKRYAKK